MYKSKLLLSTDNGEVINLRDFIKFTKRYKLNTCILKCSEEFNRVYDSKVFAIGYIVYHIQNNPEKKVLGGITYDVHTRHTKKIKIDHLYIKSEHKDIDTNKLIAHIES